MSLARPAPPSRDRRSTIELERRITAAFTRMNILALLKDRFRPALAAFITDEAQVGELLDMIRPAQDAKFGDYQANFAMSLGKQLGKPPREIAGQIIAAA